ncbi:ISL3 family transposase [Microlunatus sp. Y2014]|uniref:ISL3 family transposase n=1 Tax=Microlunatus sp. Y2014 TaxID=3418488 RepID=UPI003DA76AC5
MSNGTSVDLVSVLFGLEDEFSVLRVDRQGPVSVRVVIEQTVREGPCPGCGVLSGSVKERPTVRLKDLPASGQRMEWWWRKRRLVCAEPACPTGTFTQTAAAARPRARLTERLRTKLASAIATGNRAVSGVADEYQVSWPTAHKALIVAAASWLPEPEPTTVVGIDETRARSVRWILEEVGWRRSDPWMTSFVDCSTTGSGSLLGLTPGRSGLCVKDWLGEQTAEFRDRIEIVVIDPSAPYASGIRATLPDARIAVDKFHLVQLANQMVTEVRQRVTRARFGRRGTAADATWANRRILLTGADRLSPKQWARLGDMLDHDDPTDEIGAAWGVKERLRMLLAESEPSKIRWRLADFYEAAIDAAIPETIRLATTIQAWWPAVLVALTHQLTNARTEGFNRIIKQVKRAGCGYRNMINYERRIMTHIAVTRPQWSAA